MKTISTLACLALMFGLSGSQPLLAKAPPASSTQLLQELEAALKAKDKAAIMALYNQDGVADWVKTGQGDDVDDWLTRELKSAKLSPLPTNFPTSGEHGNIRYHINVQPVGIIELGFTDGFGTGFPYGKKGDAFYIACVITEEIAAPPDETNDLTIRVVTPDGQRLGHVPVDRCRPGHLSVLRFRKIYGEELLTDSQGQIHISRNDTNCNLLVAIGRGFGFLPASELTNQAVITVQPWGRIEGVIKNRNQPVANLQVELALDRDFYLATRDPQVRLGGETTTTDENGRFVFDSVPTLKLLINRHDNQTPFGIYVCSASVKPGETNHIQIDGRSRTVTGRVIPGPGLVANLDLTACSGALNSVVKGPDERQRNINFQVSSNGTFHTELVEPGDYKIAGDLQSDNRKVALLDPIVVHVPDDTSGAADTSFDIGAVTLKAAINLKPGDNAPGFTVNDLAGKSLKLSDYRGKYVLLDFWATWCGPCVAETPHMKETYDAFGKDNRFTMISLSLDNDPAASGKFSRRNEIAWTQGFLGDWSNDKVTGTYGVYAIPAIFLIGPDGKVIATQLRGEKIKAAVAAALAH